MAGLEQMPVLAPRLRSGLGDGGGCWGPVPGLSSRAKKTPVSQGRVTPIGARVARHTNLPVNIHLSGSERVCSASPASARRALSKRDVKVCARFRGTNRETMDSSAWFAKRYACAMLLCCLVYHKRVGSRAVLKMCRAGTIARCGRSRRASRAGEAALSRSPP